MKRRRSISSPDIGVLNDALDALSAKELRALVVNQELVLLYWQMGREIPEMKGLSRTNLLYMRKLAKIWTDEEKVPQLVGQIPWGHNRVILDRVNGQVKRQ